MFEAPLDWKISKKLIDAGGLGPRVYITIPRYNGRTYATQKYCEYLLSQGRQVIFTQPNPRGVQLQGRTLRDVIIDKDILPPPESYARAERIWNEYWKENK